MGLAWSLGKKVLGLGLIFNSVVCIASVLNLLSGFYNSGMLWRPFWPFLLDGSLLWFVLVLAILNVFSAKVVGKVHLRRFGFHHYVYGLALIFVALCLVLAFAPSGIWFLVSPQLGFESSGLESLGVYAALFFVYAGVALFIDDSYDWSKRLSCLLERAKVALGRFGWVFRMIHLVSCLVSFYVVTAIVFWYIGSSYWLSAGLFWNVSYLVLTPNLFVTCLWGLYAFREKVWVRVLFGNIRKKSE
jgi:hypothetical protein